MLFIDPIDPAFLAVAREVLAQAATAHFATRPQPDPCYTTAQAMSIRGTTPETSCAYLKLPPHPSHRLHVRITASLTGRRIMLSDLTAWQRNRHVEGLTPIVALPTKRRARRRRSFY